MENRIELQIANIVASGDLGIGELDTSAVGNSLNLDNVSTYPGRIYINRDDGPTVMLYRKGSYTIAGAKSHTSLIETVRWATEELKKISVIESSLEDSLGIKYMVFTADLGHKLDLEMLHIKLGLEDTEYEPEQFSGLLYDDQNHNCTVLLFSSGKIVITGAKTEESAYNCLNKICRTID